MNYRDAFFIANQLTALDNSESKYYYFKKKYEILKDFIYRPKLSMLERNNFQEMGLKILSLELIKEKAGLDDPDFYILSGLYFFYSLNNQFGNLAAAYLSNKAMVADSLQHVDGSMGSPLMYVADNFIKNYNFQPFDQESEVSALQFIEEKFGEKLTSLSFPEHKISNDVFSAIAETNQFNKQIRQTIEADQKEFIQFLEADTSRDKKIAIGDKFRKRWDSLIVNLSKEISVGSLFSSAVLKFDDSYVAYINSIMGETSGLNQPVSESFQKRIRESTNNLFSAEVQTGNKDSAFSMYSRLNPYRKQLTSFFVSKFKDKSKGPIILSEVTSELKRNELLAVFSKAYQNYKSQIGELGILDACKLSIELAQASADIDLYIYKTNGQSVPYGMNVLREFEAKYTLTEILRRKPDYTTLKEGVANRYITYRIPFL